MINRIRAFIRDERGAVVIDHIPVFFMLTIIVMLIIEVAMAHFLQLRTYKAVQLGARTAAALPPAIAAVPTLNAPSNANGTKDIPCYGGDGVDNCEIPVSLCPIDGLLECWTCTGAECSNGNTLELIVQEMRRVDATIAPEEITLTYIYRQLGNSGGPFLPEINVAIGGRAYEFAVLSLLLSDKDKEVCDDPDTPRGLVCNESTVFASTPDVLDATSIYSRISASAFAEDITPTYTDPASVSTLGVDVGTALAAGSGS